MPDDDQQDVPPFVFPSAEYPAPSRTCVFSSPDPCTDANCAARHTTSHAGDIAILRLQSDHVRGEGHPEFANALAAVAQLLEEHDGGRINLAVLPPVRALVEQTMFGAMRKAPREVLTR